MKIYFRYFYSVLSVFIFCLIAHGQDYDIYAVDTENGTVKQLTFLASTGEYNPNWSPDGNFIVHDVKGDIAPLGHALFVTNVNTGVSSMLAGGEGGNDPAWSPDGKWVAFDRDPPFGDPPDDQTIYIVPAQGGIPRLITTDAVNADWSPSGRRLVFQRPSDGTIRTVSINGGTGIPVYEGYNPVWSPDGKWIAFELWGDIWKIEVGIMGIPRGYPVQVTNDPYWQGAPSWSADGEKIVFHSDLDGQVDIWMISAYGGVPEKIAGSDNFDEYDPSFSKNGSWVAFSGFNEASFNFSLAENINTVSAINFKLGQNYPNPFNPKTIIPYQVAHESRVNITVYNALGNKVSSLVNDIKIAGEHSVEFNAESFPSGVYYYKIENGSFIEIRKMILVK